jgi:hypothetical protein
MTMSCKRRAKNFDKKARRAKTHGGIYQTEDKYGEER